MATYEITTEAGKVRVEGDYCREETGNVLVVGNEGKEIVRRFGADEWYWWDIVPQAKLDLERVTAERDALLDAMQWVVTQANLLHGLGRSVEKADIWTIKEHAERAIEQVQP